MDNPLAVNGFVPLKLEQVLWDTKAIVRYNSKNVIKVSPWLYEAASAGDFIRVIHGTSSALTKGTYKIHTKDSNSSFTVTSITGAASDILNGSAVSSGFDDGNVVVELLTTTDGVATTAGAAAGGTASTFKFPKFNCSALGHIDRVYFQNSETIYVAIIQADGKTSKHLVTAATADCEITTSTPVSLISNGAGGYITHGLSMAVTNQHAAGISNWKIGTDTSGRNFIDLLNSQPPAQTKPPGGIIEIFVEDDATGFSTSHVYFLDRLTDYNSLYLSRDGNIEVPTGNTNDKIHFQLLSRAPFYDEQVLTSTKIGIATTGFLMMFER